MDFEHIITPDKKFDYFPASEVEQSVARRFEKQVVKYPEHLAIKSKAHTYSYLALNQLANQIARSILAKPCIQNQPVIIFLQQGALFIATFLGVLKAGRCAVPVDPDFPESRNAKIVKDSQASLIITNQKYLAVAAVQVSENCELLNIDELDPTLSNENPEISVSPDSIAYILYTSGSTGKPKGVFQNHRNLLHFIRHQVNSLQISPDDRVTMLYSCSVNGALRGTLYSLLNGATLYPFNVKCEGLTGLINWLIEEKITIYHSVTTLFRHMTSILTLENPFPHIRMVILGGEAVSAEDVTLYKKIFAPNCLLYTGLGATETGTIREYIVNKQTPVGNSRMPLGYSVPERDILLWDEAGSEVKPGQVGEICVRSPYIALGYWNNPEKTRKAFWPDPEGGDYRIYRTGDLGKLLPDGCLVHKGRKDFQVKIRGYRVELSEIELALVRQDSVKEAVVVGREDSMGTQQLIAYVVPVSMPGRLAYRQKCWLHVRDQRIAITTEDISPHSIGIIGITDICEEKEAITLELVLPDNVHTIDLAGTISQIRNPRARIQFDPEKYREEISASLDYLREQENRFGFSESTLVATLRNHIKQLLPDYMVPSVFVLIESLPLTPNGKVDRRALPDPEPTQRTINNEFVPPRTSIEEQLSQIWYGLLQLEQVGIYDNFFELGGHSLLATQLVSRIREVFSLELPLGNLFELPTIYELAERIETLRWIHQDRQSLSVQVTEEREEIEF